MRHSLVGLIFIVLVTSAWPASAHLFNHQDRHEVCDIYAAPQVHAETDGHAHWHHLGAAAQEHLHGGVPFPAGHTHADTFHDPCDQAGMLAYGFADAPPFSAPPLPDLVIGVPVTGQIDIILRDVLEGVRLPIPSIIEQQTLLVNGDADLARFPGSGTPADPYVIEGYQVRNLLSIKDTTKCIVVRNNVVYNDLVQGPIVDPDLILRLDALVAQLTGVVDSLTGAQVQATIDLTSFNAVFDQLKIDRDTWRDQNALMVAERDALQAAVDADQEERKAARADAKVTMRAIKNATNDLRDALEAYDIALPPTPDAALDPLDPAFESAADAVAVAAQQAPADATIDALRAELASLGATYVDQKVQVAAADAALAQSKAARDAFEPVFDAFKADFEAWKLDVFEPAKLHREALQLALSDVNAALTQASAQLADAQMRLADHPLEYLDHAFDTLEELARWAVAHLQAPSEELAGRLVLDWNGQCVHAYHNVIQDLRVNRNNARTGYATGGLLEDNRIFDVGQIRHYDGEFRENEIGDRLYIERYLSGTASAPPSDASGDAYAANSPAGGPVTVALRPGRVINADGFNEAWMHDNVIYGSVDLDLHGHHHGAGFFSRESHYHGDLYNQAYMVNATSGNCLYSYPSEPGPLHPLGVDEPLPLLHEEPGCLPHHDHTKRWTSVRFEDNVILDPLGYGLRYEDQNHAGDDRIAASETTIELNKPHFHRTHIALADNVVMGSVWVDVFNADGVKLWSDDHTEVKVDPAGIVTDTLEHLGAEIIDSHPGRNDGWLDIKDNAVFVVDKASEVRAGHDAWSAFQLTKGKEITKLDLAGNSAFFAGRGFDADVATAPALAAKLVELSGLTPSEAFAIVQSWGGAHPSHAASHGVLLRDVADSLVRVCANAMLGFARGLEATDTIRPDVGFQRCNDNDWGAAIPAWSTSFTEYPEEEAELLAPVWAIADGTQAESNVHSLHDHVGRVVPP